MAAATTYTHPSNRIRQDQRVLDSKAIEFGTDGDAELVHDGSTGLQLLIADNDADAFEIAQSTNVYFHCDTRDDQERVVVTKILSFGAPQTIDMADAQVALVYGTAGAGEVKVTSNLLLVDANSGTTEDLLLPPEATSTGVFFWISNTGGEDIVVKEDSDTTTICTISTAESGWVACDGTTWRGGVVKAT